MVVQLLLENSLVILHMKAGYLVSPLMLKYIVMMVIMMVLMLTLMNSITSHQLKIIPILHNHL